MKFSQAILSVLVFCSSLAQASALDCSRKMGSLPNDKAKAGAINKTIPIEHIIVIMQENHSFDNYFGRLNQPEHYGSAVDGVLPSMMNLDSNAKAIYSHHEETLCVANPKHDWDSMHRYWNSGKNDLFVSTNANNPQVIGYFDESDIPFYYALADRFAIADRYFASTMTQTYPNRFFLLTGSAFGHVRNDPPFFSKYSQKTIFQLLSENGISWKYYNDGSGYLPLFSYYATNKNKLVPPGDFAKDLNSNQLPQVSFIDASGEGEDEHPSQDIQVGQSFVADKVKALVSSPYWQNSVLFLTYDEGGGFFDHVSPPEACLPDNIKPKRLGSPVSGDYDRYGFRVPFVAVSPFAKSHFVSHQTYDHTSILKFIETKFNLPALTARDANAGNMLDLFDFDHPNLTVSLPSGAVDPAKRCKD